jgi:chromate transporter
MALWRAVRPHYNLIPMTQSRLIQASQVPDHPPAVPERPIPKIRDIFFEFLLIGLVSFGGGIMAYERRLLLDKRKWLTNDEFMAILAMGQTMPGLNSVNLAMLSGDRIRGLFGAMAAVIGLISPGVCFVLTAAVAYSQGADYPLADVLLAGVSAGATGLIASVTLRIGRPHFKRVKSVPVILATFVCMSFFKLSLVTVLIIMVPIGLWLHRPAAGLIEIDVEKKE